MYAEMRVLDVDWFRSFLECRLASDLAFVGRYNRYAERDALRHVYGLFNRTKELLLLPVYVGMYQSHVTVRTDGVRAGSRGLCDKSVEL